MSVRRESSLILYCDSPDCLNRGTFVGATAGDARIKAIRARWRVGRAKAVCGGCQDRHVAATGKRSAMFDGYNRRSPLR